MHILSVNPSSICFLSTSFSLSMCCPLDNCRMELNVWQPRLHLRYTCIVTCGCPCEVPLYRLYDNALLLCSLFMLKTISLIPFLAMLSTEDLEMEGPSSPSKWKSTQRYIFILPSCPLIPKLIWNKWMLDRAFTSYKCAVAILWWSKSSIAMVYGINISSG